MSATNVTTYYKFPVFVGSDKPAWLVDWNGAMNAIDSAIHEAKTEADANATNIASLQSSVTSLSGSVESQGSSITSLTQSLTALQGTVNTITSLIGNGLPTTDDKTIIGAINELKAEIDAIAPSGDVKADDVTYDNTTSGLTATNVQSAIDELAQSGGGGSTKADDVSYDNTTSGLTATNVQDAIDEVAGIENANDFGTIVDLLPYTSTLYEFPSDGYVQVDSGPSANTVVGRILGHNATDINSTPVIAITAFYSTIEVSNSVYVKKGMKAYVVQTSTGGFARFVPLA